MITIVAPHEKDIGFPVKRLLPSAQQRHLGPFVFLDHMGPATFQAGTTEGDVRPHPHIGLATVTYLFSGAMVHRDSIGTVQRIEPGAINLMTAGKGIVHSERMPADIRTEAVLVQGIQTWLALPEPDESSAPQFAHYAATELPNWSQHGLSARVLIGSAFGLTSPVSTRSPTTYADLQFDAGTRYELPASAQELGLYVAGGSLRINGMEVAANHLAVLQHGASHLLETGAQPARALLLGGEPMAGPRHLNWNFVSSSLERIHQARDDWQNGRFPKVPGETEWIPLP
ncbi:pirin family protein [Undibacterium arcticum]|uniref:Pirin family protein n=1 Tax=Undibacterium arcticum TaxID=1762892 RepID=A0ABV7EWH2_9BURK